jgi:hypothetical protein
MLALANSAYPRFYFFRLLRIRYSGMGQGERGLPVVGSKLSSTFVEITGFAGLIDTDCSVAVEAATGPVVVTLYG